VRDKFRVRSKRLLVTWAQTPDWFDWEEVVKRCHEKGGKIVLAQEEHQDGGLHFHAYMEHPTRFMWRGSRHLDVSGVHPNIEPITATPWIPWNYVRKDGNVLTDEIPNEPQGRRTDKKATSEATVWTSILHRARNETEFLTMVKDKLPRDFAKSFNNIQNAGRWYYRKDTKPGPYEGPDGLVPHLDAYPEITEWVERHLHTDEHPGLAGSSQPSAGSDADSAYHTGESVGDVGLGSSSATDSWDDELSRYESPEGAPSKLKTNPKPQARIRSLILWGPTKLGKTLVARSWGPHSYFGSRFNLDALNRDCKYAVFDDMEGGMRDIDYKQWLGAQYEFTVTDKYKRKESIIWNKPCVWLCNKNPFETEKRVDLEWLEGNALVVHIDKPICNFAT